ncbi:RsmE family RNA methyltransferase [Bacteroidetes bacterium endosymbiont of Geopemphigus sp.]|uniref:RsmE family RNA methyltransferase n=1 Tax=Bacteroidetes bacterium endosymbiont of Geopemphigus sp. TaxID=2047937 RepID=UPI000CD30DA4|nr:RsmE family RNA methyltransferase [Bacteroidetes bacterium endosymbiont of Geopemphigus sp.]
MHLFFGEKIASSQLELAYEEVYHLSKVLRLPVGQEILLTNGAGDLWKARLNKVLKNRAEADIVEHFPEYRKSFFSFHIAIALPKSIDRFEWFLEKSTELGVAQITPVICKRSLRTRFSHGRSVKIIRSAVKQSIRAYMPLLNQVISYDHFLDYLPPSSGECFIAHCEDHSSKVSLKSLVNLSVKNYTVLIGPEGDFSSEEIREALDRNWQGVSLGAFRLRVETAALSALHTIKILTDKN